MAKKTGLKIDGNAGCYDRRCIVFDKSGVPWVIDPDMGSISLAKVVAGESDKMPAVAKKTKR